MLGAAVGLIRAKARDHLSGKVFFLGTPAEEFIEIEERLRMREQGKIQYLGGKQELVRLGYLKDKHLCMLVHAHSGLTQRKMLFGGRTNGFLAKSIRFHGKPAHAGVSPHEGINALNAACLAIINIHAQRETFREDDQIRVHPIITKGGDVVNVVPYDVRMETYVRGARLEAITDANAKVDRSILAGADAVGAKVAIQNIPGYLPLIQNPAMSQIAKSNALALVGEEGVGAAGGPLYAPTYSPESALGVFHTIREYFAPQIVGQEFETARDLVARSSTSRETSSLKGPWKSPGGCSRPTWKRSLSTSSWVAPVRSLMPASPTE
jgi:metal-dependent amidase/aminoacylase/carboxypeptidase family protein